MDPLDVVNAKTRHAYNLAAERYHELFSEELDGKAYDRQLLDGFAGNFSVDSLVCDAGCGPSAHIGRYVFEQGIPVVGVDIADRCVALARRHNPALRFARGDLGAMPFADGAFDGVIAYYSIIDTPRRHVARLFREFHRVLAPGGRLLVAVKAGATEGWVPELLGMETEIYFSLFTQDEIGGYCEEAGFSVELLERRNPYDFEIDAERVFAIGRRG